MKRYPIEPLAKALRIDLGQPGRRPDDLDHGLSALIQMLDDAGRPRSLSTVKRWLKTGVDAELAEWLACRLALVHVLNIWPDWDDDGEIEGLAHSA